MNRPRLLQILRISWTAFWGVACVLLVALWVRSYTWLDVASYRLASFWGRIYYNNQFAFMPLPGRPPFIEASHPHFLCTSFVVDDFFIQSYPGGTWIPYWFLVLPCVAFAVLPWRRQLTLRFSLRTLLLAITLLSVLLGHVVWSMS
jgi:hypothetical protein